MSRKSVRLLSLILISVFLLSACTTAQSAGNPDMEIPDSVDLTDLESLSFIPGDLPEGFALTHAVRSLPDTYIQVENFSDMVYMLVEKENFVQGGLYIFLFENNTNRDNAYQLIHQELGSRAATLNVELQDVPDVGEKAAMLGVKGSSIGIDLNVVELVFEHCGSVVHLSMGDDASLDEVEKMVTNYGARLANRLDTLACQEN